MKEIDFKREIFIKDLFNAQMILNQFDLIHFENLATFNKCILNDLFYIEENKSIKISLNNFEEYEGVLKIFEETNICDKMDVILKISKQEVFDEVLSNVVPKKYAIEVTENVEAGYNKYWETGKEWISKNRLVQIISMNADNFDEKINKTISIYNQQNIRFFEFDVDYESFNELKLGGLDKLKYWLHHLRDWLVYDMSNRLNIMKSDFYKPIFISEDLILYLNDKKRHWIWACYLGHNINKTGEDIPYKELNKLRTYLDLHTEAMYSEYDVFNWKLIDFEQCLKMYGSINEIPLIMILFGRWLHDSF